MRLFGLFLSAGALALTLSSHTPVFAAVSAQTITSPAQLLTGTAAKGQLGDIILANDEIVVVISALGHVTTSGVNGGTIIDAGTATARSDALGELYTFFDATWPRQAHYNTLVITNDGTGGGPAVVRATGYDSGNPAQVVATYYSLADGARHVVLTTRVTGSGSTQPGFELGDAFQWGTCSKYAPGYGSAISGTTTQAWMAGRTADVCYAYAGTTGDGWGPNGTAWSNINVASVNLVPGATASYTRYFAVAPGEIAAAATILYEALGVATGTVVGTITAQSSGTPLTGATIDVFDGNSKPLLQMIANGSGQATTRIPVGLWRLMVSAPGYTTVEDWVTVTANSSDTRAYALVAAGGTAGSAIGDTLTVIQRPLVNIPTFVTPGQMLRIDCAADPLTTGWQAEISVGGLTVPLSVSTATYDPATTWWTLQAATPAVDLYELYDLRVTADGGLDDTARHAVRVLERFKDDYYFIHITDTHLPDHRFSSSGGSPADSTETLDLRAVIADINVINPEFVLITGDFVNEGELEDY